MLELLVVHARMIVPSRGGTHPPGWPFWRDVRGTPAPTSDVSAVSSVHGHDQSRPFTGDPEADQLLVDEPLALLIGFVLNQQVPLQKAFSGPLELRRRIGDLDAQKIAAMEPDQLDEVFRERPALHRFPGNMARRTRELAEFIVERYGGDAGRVWTEARDGADLHARLLELPGIGPMKAGTLSRFSASAWVSPRPAGRRTRRIT